MTTKDSDSLLEVDVLKKAKNALEKAIPLRDLDLYEDVEEVPVDEKTQEEKNEKMKKIMEKVINENKK